MRWGDHDDDDDDDDDDAAMVLNGDIYINILFLDWMFYYFSTGVFFSSKFFNRSSPTVDASWVRLGSVAIWQISCANPSHLRSRYVASQSCFTACGCYRTRGLNFGGFPRGELREFRFLKYELRLDDEIQELKECLDCLVLFLCMQWSVANKRSFLQIVSHSEGFLENRKGLDLHPTFWHEGAILLMGSEETTVINVS